MKFKKGDKVKWVETGLIGTVLTSGQSDLVLCEFEGWDGGHNGGTCTCHFPEVPKTEKRSRWWFDKKDLEKVRGKKK